jgi:hypothetical protein
VIELLINLFSPIPELQHALLPLEVLRVKECAPTPSLSIVFTLGLTIESIKELGGASHGIKALVELDPPIGEFQWHQKGP